MSSKLLQPSQLWRELATGSRSNALVEAIAVELAADPIWSIADFKDSIITIPFTYSMTTNSLVAADSPPGRDYLSMAR